MKTLTRSFLVTFICAGFAIAAYAGPERIESKEVVPAPAPDCCQWTGFYLGAHIGGQFGNTDDTFDIPNSSIHFSWGYDESGIVGGGQFGYNWQWRWLVLGGEADIGYMNLDGKANSPVGSPSFSNFELGESSSDFYTTFRARIGMAHDCWLFYVTGGGIGVNYETRYTFIPAPSEFTGDEQDFVWGYTVGGGVERKLGCHWSLKLEYLYFNLEDQSFDRPFVSGGGTTNSLGITAGPGSQPMVHFTGETDGHIVRAGLNYHF